MAVTKQFELQQVLNYRTELEKLRKQDFAAARHDLDQATEYLCWQQQQVVEQSILFNDKQNEIQNIFEMQLYVNFLAGMRDGIKRQQLHVETLESVVEERRVELTQATKDKKVLEQLKEKKAELFRKSIAYKESLLLDEIATQKKRQE